MLIKSSKFYTLNLLIALLLALSILYSDKVSAKEIKVGFIYVSAVDNAGWTQAHDFGRLAIDKIPGVTTYFVESVSEEADNPQLEAVLRHMAESKYDLIFATSFGHMDTVQKIAPQYPNVIFMHCSSQLLGKNIGNYFGRIYEARYLTGIVAGAMTKSNIVGYIAAYPIPEVIRGINAFTVGVLESNPHAKVHVRWTKNWNDPSKEKRLANAMIDLGADIISQHQDSPSTLIVAKERDIYVMGYNQDMHAFAPKTYLTAPVWNWSVVYKHIIRKVMSENWKSESIWWGLKQGAVDIAPFGPMVPEKLRQKVLRKKKDILFDNFAIFTGPIIDQAGNIRIPKGKQATDDDLLSMNWFLKGVVGTPTP